MIFSGVSLRLAAAIILTFFFFGVSLNLFLLLQSCMYMYINVKECQQSNDRAIKTRKTQCKIPGGRDGGVETVHAFLVKVAEQENGGSIV